MRVTLTQIVVDTVDPGRPATGCRRGEELARPRSPGEVEVRQARQTRLVRSETLGNGFRRFPVRAD